MGIPATNDQRCLPAGRTTKHTKSQGSNVRDLRRAVLRPTDPKPHTIAPGGVDKRGYRIKNTLHIITGR